MKFFLLSVLTMLAHTLGYSIEPAQIDISSHPTLGDPKASVQVVAFLEPKCPDSKRYNNESFPKLQSEFINTNKIRYTVITTSFLYKSMPAAMALLCVYNQQPGQPNTDLFFKYLNYIYLNQPPEKQNWATIETLQNFAAKASPTIDLDKLKSCIESNSYRAQIEKNTALGNQIMGHLSTPTIYVDGIKVENADETIDYDNLKKAIQEALNKSKS